MAITPGSYHTLTTYAFGRLRGQIPPGSLAGRYLTRVYHRDALRAAQTATTQRSTARERRIAAARATRLAVCTLELSNLRRLLPATLREIADLKRIGIPTLDWLDPLDRLAAVMAGPTQRISWRNAPARKQIDSSPATT